MKKFNQKYLRAQNQGQILKVLREKGPLSRAQIAQKIDIARSTVSEITNEMVDINIITEGQKVKGNLGKRPTLLFFNKNYFYYISVAIKKLNAIIAICNLEGKIIKEKIIGFEDTITAKAILKSVFHIIDELLNDVGKENICLISVSSPETLNIRTGKIKWAPYIKDWIGLDLKAFFYKRYQVEVIVKDHMKLETMGEHWKSFSNIDNMVYIIITNGIGSGAIIDGKIREGKNGYLGEIAFLPIAQNIDYKKLSGSNKDLGYFESKCDIRQITSLTKRYLKKNKDPKDIKSFQDVTLLYKTDKNIKNLINAGIMKSIALGIATVIIVLDPEIVVINGEIIELGSGFLNFLKEEIYKIIPYRRELVFSKLKDRACLYGTIKNGLDYVEKLMYQNPEYFLNIRKKSEMHY